MQLMNQKEAPLYEALGKLSRVEVSASSEDPSARFLTPTEVCILKQELQ